MAKQYRNQTYFLRLYILEQFSCVPGTYFHSGSMLLQGIRGKKASACSSRSVSSDWLEASSPDPGWAW